jgi:hypothetical protein
MIDRDLSDLYKVETRSLNQAVRRNINRFPDDFMFQLSEEEFANWKSQIVISNQDKMGLRKRPLAFTEQGVAMLSSILKSETAIMVNIEIIRVFTKLRQFLESHESILDRLDALEKEGIIKSNSIKLIFSLLKQLQEENNQNLVQKNRRKIGFNR